MHGLRTYRSCIKLWAVQAPNHSEEYKSTRIELYRGVKCLSKIFNSVLRQQVEILVPQGDQ